MPDRKKDTFQIRNSTVDFLVFTRDAHEGGIEVRVQDQDVWLTQKAIAQLFEVDRSVVTKHLKNVYESGELSETATCANFAQVADSGKTSHNTSTGIMLCKNRPAGRFLCVIGWLSSGTPGSG